MRTHSGRRSPGDDHPLQHNRPRRYVHHLNAVPTVEDRLSTVRRANCDVLVNGNGRRELICAIPQNKLVARRGSSQSILNCVSTWYNIDNTQPPGNVLFQNAGILNSFNLFVMSSIEPKFMFRRGRWRQSLGHNCEGSTWQQLGDRANIGMGAGQA